MPQKSKATQAPAPNKVKELVAIYQAKISAAEKPQNTSKADPSNRPLQSERKVVQDLIKKLSPQQEAKNIADKLKTSDANTTKGLKAQPSQKPVISSQR